MSSICLVAVSFFADVAIFQIVPSGAYHAAVAQNPFVTARQPVVQGRSLSGLRTTQMCLIRSPATSNANTVTVTPSCWATRPGWPLTVRSRIVMVPGARSAISTQARAICSPPSIGCEEGGGEAAAVGDRRGVGVEQADQGVDVLGLPGLLEVPDDAGLPGRRGRGSLRARMRRRAEEASWRHAAGVRPTISATSAKE